MNHESNNENTSKYLLGLAVFSSSLSDASQDNQNNFSQNEDKNQHQESTQQIEPIQDTEPVQQIEPIQQTESVQQIEQVQTPEMFAIKIVINDMHGNDDILELQLSNDITQAATSIIELTVSDVLDAYCSKHGIENEGLLILTPKWTILYKSSKIWPLFLKKSKTMKNSEKAEKRKKQRQNRNKKSMEKHLFLELESPKVVLEKMIKILSKQPYLTIRLNLRQNEAKTNHFDIIVTRIPYNMKEDQLYAHFQRIGTVSQVIIFKSINGKSKGIARVTFEKEKDANEAIINGKTLSFVDSKNQYFFNVFKPKIQFASATVKGNKFDPQGLVKKNDI